MDCSRRRVLQYGAGLALLPLSGCATFQSANEEATVDLMLVNSSNAEQSVEVTIKSDGETVFEESYNLSTPEGESGSISEPGILEAGQYTVVASNDTDTREYQYRSTCANVDDMDDKIYVSFRNNGRLEISSTYCGK